MAKIQTGPSTLGFDYYGVLSTENLGDLPYLQYIKNGLFFLQNTSLLKLHSNHDPGL